MTAKKLDHPLELFIALSRIGEKGIVAASFAIRRLDGFLVRSQGRLECARQANPRVLSETIRRAVHDQDRHVELCGTIPGSESRNPKSEEQRPGRFHPPADIAASLQRRESARRSRSIGADAGDPASRLYQGVDNLYGFRILTGDLREESPDTESAADLIHRSASAA